MLELKLTLYTSVSLMCYRSHKTDVATNEQYYSTEDIKKNQDEYWK